MAGGGVAFMGLCGENVDGSGVGGKGDGGFVRARSGRAKDNEAGSGDVVVPKDFYRVGVRANFGGDPGFALGLFDEKAKLFEGLNPDRPKSEEVFWFNDKDNVVDVCKNLYDVFGVPVGEGERGLVKKVVNCSSKVRAEDGGGEALALENTLCDFKV